MRHLLANSCTYYSKLLFLFPIDLVDVKDVDEFLSLSPESLRLDGDTDEVISSFLTSEVDFDDLSSSSSDVSSSINLSDLLGSPCDDEDDINDKNNNKSETSDVRPVSTNCMITEVENSVQTTTVAPSSSVLCVNDCRIRLSPDPNGRQREGCCN